MSVSDDVITAAQFFIEPHEGCISYMYQDSNGYVTVGIGNMLPTVQSALPLIWQFRTGSGVEPTELDIADEYKRISEHRASDLRAEAYKELTTMDLPQGEIRRLFAKRVQEFARLLEASVYPRFSTYPVPAQVALLDLAFNLGAAALAKRWPKLDAAVNAEDWAAAALASNRPQSSEARNVGTATLFGQAAELAAGQDPTAA